MSLPSEQSGELQGHDERPETPARRAPSCSVGHGHFCDAAWKGIADKLGLSPRQVAVCRGVLIGHGDKQIARKLGVSLRTVQTHVLRLHEKLEIQNRVELATRVFAAYHAWRTESHPPAGCPQKYGLESL
jgi:DNA-binding NarL/FixJ family response regulator